MSRILTIAWRDFRLTVLRPAFLIAVIGIPVLVVALAAASILLVMGHKEPPLVGTIVLLTDAEDVVATVAQQFAEEGAEESAADQLQAMAAERPADLAALGPKALPQARGAVEITIERQAAGDGEALASLKERVRSGGLLAAAVVPTALIEASEAASEDTAGATFELYVAERTDTDHTSLIERAIGEGVIAARAERRGLAPAERRALLERPQPATRRLLESGEEATEGRLLREIRQMIPMVFFMLLWIACFTAGQHLMMSTIEEKSNRVMEVLLSAVSPLQLMAGKILGQGGVGLIILVIYGFLGIASLIAFAYMQLIEVESLLFVLVYFFMAYFMIATIMAAVGSAVSDIREANTLFTPVMILLMLLWGLWWPISNDPNGAIATAFSFIPPAIPFAMVLRLAADEPVPLWQVPATILWGYVCVVLMVRGAARIFRVGVLMYGKPPSLLELAKWVRYR